MNRHVDNVENSIRWWYPRDILMRTNWLYRIDALRPYDRREMRLFFELASMFLEYCTLFLCWGYSLQTMLKRVSGSFKNNLEKVIRMIFAMTALLWSEGYCHYLTFLKIA